MLISKDADVAGRVAENVRGLELEVSVLRELKHPNIVQYLVGPFSKCLPEGCCSAICGLQSHSYRPMTALESLERVWRDLAMITASIKKLCRHDQHGLHTDHFFILKGKHSTAYANAKGRFHDSSTSATISRGTSGLEL